MCVCRNFVHKCSCVSIFLLCSLSCGWCSFADVPSREIGSFPVGTICSNLFCCFFCHIYTASGQFTIASVKEMIENTVYLCDWVNGFTICGIFISPRYKFLYDMQSVLPTCFRGKIFYLDFAKLWHYHLLLEACA